MPVGGREKSTPERSSGVLPAGLCCSAGCNSLCRQRLVELDLHLRFASTWDRLPTGSGVILWQRVQQWRDLLPEPSAPRSWSTVLSSPSSTCRFATS